MVASPWSSSPDTERARQLYRYKTRDENRIAPIAVAGEWPRWDEDYGFSPSWILPFVPGVVAAHGRRFLQDLRFGVEKATFRFDKLQAYRKLFPGRLPEGMAEHSDEVFAYARVAGPNGLGLRQEKSLVDLRTRIPLDPARIEARLRPRLGRGFSLAKEAAKGKLFFVDFEVIKRALRPQRTRDSRWRGKYLPAPIGVFLEAPGFYEQEPHPGLVPLAIQIDQCQPHDEHNPTYYPDDGWGWRIAKLYFEVADVSYHVACGHVFRTHLQMEPFCLATPRQLPQTHPVFQLIRPHTRLTLPSNAAAYHYLVDRDQTYFEFYAGTLDETRAIAVESYHDTGFMDLELETEHAHRGVDRAPAHYPYPVDAGLWLRPIREFVKSYVDAFYGSPSEVVADSELQAWAKELMYPGPGALRRLVPDDRLDTKKKLIDLLSQVLFIAGPGHASQHYSSNYYYRYAPAFAGAAHVPPPWKPSRAHEARYQNTLPPIRTASKQIAYNTFTNFQYDRFGDYRRYPMGRKREAQQPIRRLRAALDRVERIIRKREEGRMLSYPFLLPSRVPNSANI